MKWIIDSKLLLLAKEIMEDYSTHKSYCEIAQTDFCTCGLTESLRKYKKMIADLQRDKN